MELSVTKKIWDLILKIVAAIADLFSADEEEFIRMIANDSEKIAVIKKLCIKNNTAYIYLRNLNYSMKMNLVNVK